MAKFSIEAHIVEDEEFTDYSRTNALFNEVTQLQQKYGVACEIAVEPFENTSFLDLMFITQDDFKHSGFVFELEELLDEHGANYVYKSVLD